MFQRFLPSRIPQLVKNYLGGDDFKVRSAERDRETDRARIRSVLTAIDDALRAAESEHSGLKIRVEDVLAKAAVTMGTAADEYLDREPHRSRHLDLFEAEIANGQGRLAELSTMVGHLKFMRAAFLSRFPDLK